MGSRLGGGGVCVHKHDVTKRFDVLDIRNVRSITDLVTVNNGKKSEDGRPDEFVQRARNNTIHVGEPLNVQPDDMKGSRAWVNRNNTSIPFLPLHYQRRTVLVSLTSPNF